MYYFNDFTSESVTKSVIINYLPEKIILTEEPLKGLVDLFRVCSKWYAGESGLDLLKEAWLHHGITGILVVIIGFKGVQEHAETVQIRQTTIFYKICKSMLIADRKFCTSKC